MYVCISPGLIRSSTAQLWHYGRLRDLLSKKYLHSHIWPPSVAIFLTLRVWQIFVSEKGVRNWRFSHQNRRIEIRLHAPRTYSFFDSTTCDTLADLGIFCPKIIYTNSLVNVDSFYANFTNTTFHQTDASKYVCMRPGLIRSSTAQLWHYSRLGNLLSKKYLRAKIVEMGYFTIILCCCGMNRSLAYSSVPNRCACTFISGNVCFSDRR